MAALCRDYFAACNAVGAGPDAELLAPIAAVFEELKASAAPPQEGKR